MKHGDKAKAKSAKASSKPSDKKSGKAVAAKSGPKGGKEVAAKASPKAGKAVPAKQQAGGKATPPAKASRPAARDEAGEPAGISNPLVASALRRAIKKYSNAFRRLTD